MAASSLDEAERRWSERSLGVGALPAWERHGQDVSDGVHSWGLELARSLRAIGAQPGEAYLRQYVTKVVGAAAAGRYSDGIRDAARDRRWRAGFLAGIQR